MPEKLANTAAPVTNDHHRAAHLPKNMARPKGVEKDPLAGSDRGRLADSSI